MNKERRCVESVIQKELVKWLRKGFPEVEIRYNKNENKINAIQAMIDKQMGQAVAGVPDLQLLVNKNNKTYILELEIKIIKGILNTNQKRWHAEFVETSNRIAKVGYGFIQCKELITNWLNSLTKE